MSLLAAIATIAIPGCASRTPTSSTQGTTVVRTGQVTDIRDVTVRGGRSSGLGSFAGAVLGGVAGSTIGSGYGRAAAGVGGALAGSMAGQHLEQTSTSASMTELTIRLENGETRTYPVQDGGNFRIGDSVTVTTHSGVTQITQQFRP
jgi:outer membrane lipoprotein SlyB